MSRQLGGVIELAPQRLDTVGLTENPDHSRTGQKDERYSIGWHPIVKLLNICRPHKPPLKVSAITREDQLLGAGIYGLRMKDFQLLLMSTNSASGASPPCAVDYLWVVTNPR